MRAVFPLPLWPIDKGIPGPRVLADVIASKDAEHLPLYRQQGRYGRPGMKFSRSTLCGCVGHVASMLSPVVGVMKSAFLASGKVRTDDTPITVLDPSVKSVGSQNRYMWVYTGDRDDMVFDYTNSRKRDGPASIRSPTCGTC